MTTMSVSRPARIAMVAFAALALSVAPALAQAGKGRSMGSRGSQTYSAPPATQTAPNQARPMERSVAQPQQAQPGAAAQRPGQQPAAQAPSFGKALMGGILGGFLGAGLFSLLSGGGLGGLGGAMMLLLQIALIAGLAFLVISFFRRRSQQPAMATAGMQDNAPLRRDMQAMNGGGVGNMGGFGAAAGKPLTIGPDDYSAFERLLGDVQAAYSREDVGALRTITTPEMAVYLDEGISDTAAQGKVDRFGKPELLQGDLAEAWSEGEDDYATVAMRFAMPVATLDKATGKVVSGDLDKPREFTEVWTFRRSNGGPWVLSAIQQTQ
jgi:predicted lipid-binding transport protein (Tim44 family)